MSRSIFFSQPNPAAGETAKVLVLRWGAAFVSLAAGIAAALMYLTYAAATGLSYASWGAAFLLGLSTIWLAWGAVQGMIGLAVRMPAVPELPPDAPISARTIVLMPICNEDPTETFARLAAMHGQMQAYDVDVDFAILSDTRSPANAQAEEEALALLLRHAAVAPDATRGRIFYRRRSDNHGRKAGNIGEFIRTAGGAWDLAMVLDADSLMEAETIITMIRRMEAQPDLGLLQSLPRIVAARSLFGRAMQFSAAFHGPVFTRGLARMQGRTGPFWGHNAMIRLRAFAQSCGLPDLEGPPPFGGHILSHDYVEAALLARAGWAVRVDPDLGGSYEEAPENLVAHAKRDRRWCQGNLQHARLIRTNGLRFWNRVVFVQGIMAYLSSGFWALFLMATALGGLWQKAHDYFPGEALYLHDYIVFLPVLPTDESLRALGLLIGIFGLLLLPKLLVMVEAILSGRVRGFGGIVTAMASVLVELVISALIAPVLMAFQCRSVLQVLSGRDGGWPPNMRGDGRMDISEAYEAAKFIPAAGLIALVAAWYLTPVQMPWLLPVLLPMVFAPVLIAATSVTPRGRRLFATPEERQIPAIVASYHAILGAWTAMRAAPAQGAPAPQLQTV